jgi:hypothetical protein
MVSGCGSSGHGSSAGGSKKPAIVKLQVGGFPIELLGFEGKLWWSMKRTTRFFGYSRNHAV